MRQILSRAKTGPPSILILISESDEIVSQPLNVRGLLQRWDKALGSDGEYPVEMHKDSTCIKDATHTISGDGLAQQSAKLVTFRGALLRYIENVVGGVDQMTWDIYQQEKQQIIHREQGGVGDEPAGSHVIE